jgi:hypothetical protein
LRQAFVHHCGWVWRQASGRVRGMLGHGLAESAPADGDGSYAKARARFWDELRAGQREADAHRGKLDS